MDEPMDELLSQEGGNNSANSENTATTGSIAGVLHNCTKLGLLSQDYVQDYWPKLDAAITQLLGPPDCRNVPISYEQTYSCVYNSVCRKFSERLHADLLSHIRQYLTSYHVELTRALETSDTFYVCKFQEFLKRYLEAMSSIVPIFNYLNRVYVQNKLGSDLSAELRQLLVITLIEPHITKILDLLCNAIEKPFTLCPSIISNIIVNLHTINPENYKLRPALFAKYIPNLGPSSNLTQLDQFIMETHALQQALRIDPLFSTSDLSRKRPLEDDGTSAG